MKYDGECHMLASPDRIIRVIFNCNAHFAVEVCLGYHADLVKKRICKVSEQIWDWEWTVGTSWMCDVQQFQNYHKVQMSWKNFCTNSIMIHKLASGEGERNFLRPVTVA